MKKFEADIKMRTADMYSFMLRQQYSGFKGICAFLLSAIVVFLLIIRWQEYDTTARLLMIFILFLFDVYMPFQLFLRAKSQVVAADRFQASTHYVVDENGITVSQSGEELGFDWGHFVAYKNTKKRVFVYTTRITAFVIPKDIIGDENTNILLDYLKTNKSEFGTKSLETARHILPEDMQEEASEESES